MRNESVRVCGGRPCVPGLALALLLAGSAMAATFSVNSTVDEFDTPSGASLSLREALRDANELPGDDTVVFDPSLSGGSIGLASNMMIRITNNVVIDATALPGGLTLKAMGGMRRLFLTTFCTVTFRGLTICNGFDYQGGAIWSYGGRLDLERCTFTNNGAYGYGDLGGGGVLLQESTGTWSQCTFQGNSSTTLCFGGAVSSIGSSLVLTNCTFMENVSSYEGGAIYSEGLLELNHCTVVGNSSRTNYIFPWGNGGGIMIFGPLTLQNSIVASNSAPGAGPGKDIFSGGGSYTRVGANIVQDFGGWNLTNGAVSGPEPIAADPMLYPPGRYSGLIPTRPPMPGSPAIDAASNSTVTVDASGQPRPSDGDNNGTDIADIGAVERQTLRILNANTDGAGSLPQVVRGAMANPGERTFLFDPALAGQTVTLTNELYIYGNVTLDARGLAAPVTLDAGGLTRIFNIGLGSYVTLGGLNLHRGAAPGSVGGALYTYYSAVTMAQCRVTGGSASQGGGLYVHGNATTLNDCELVGNSATLGGGIRTDDAYLFLNRCTLVSNSAGFAGGGVFQFGLGAALTRCTLYGNGSSYMGGGVYNYGAGVSLVNCTVHANGAFMGGGLCVNENYGPSIGTYSIADSIIAGNGGYDIYNDIGYINFAGVNIANSVYRTIVYMSGTYQNIDPRLAPLGNYGGPTRTLALLPDSPARNIFTGGTSTNDQRLYPVLGFNDLGAYEAGTFANYNAWIWETLTNAAADHASTADVDGDGVSNGDEWSALTDPNSATNYLRALAFATGTNTLVTFPSVTNRTYTLETASAVTGPWADSGLAAISGDGTLRAFTNVPGSATQRFYRVKAGP